MRGCRSSVVLFLYWLLSVVCSLVPLKAKIQLAVEQVREMTCTPNLGHPFHGPVLKPIKTCMHTHIHTCMYKQWEKRTHACTCTRFCTKFDTIQSYYYQSIFVAAIFRESFICYDLSYEYINPSQGCKMCPCEIWKERVNIHLIKCSLSFHEGNVRFVRGNVRLKIQRWHFA